MNDRIPGSCWDNPIWYKRYRIYLSNMHEVHGFEYEFTHNDYDGAEDANDNRHGQGYTIDQCKEQIDNIEDENE